MNVKVGTRKMKANFTPEMIQDLESYYGIDVQAEIESLLKSEIGKETRKEKIENLLNYS